MQQTVLVIDDQWSMQELARIVLQTAGYRVLSAGDSAMGLSLARLERPDVIVLDLRLSGAEGLEVLRGLHRDPHTSKIPIVLITNPTADEQPAQDQFAGASSCLQKPFPPPELLITIDRVLHDRSMPLAV
ncbi:MAG: response regulator [Armatimonadota bacterium]